MKKNALTNKIEHDADYDDYFSGANLEHILQSVEQAKAGVML